MNKKIILEYFKGKTKSRKLKIKFFFKKNFFFYLFRATPMACGGSQARGPIRVVATSLRHSHSESEPHLRPMVQLMATPDPLTY